MTQISFSLRHVFLHSASHFASQAFFPISQDVDFPWDAGDDKT